jgi:hypothetical protein
MNTEVKQLTAQRNRAIACAILSIVISLSLVMSNFRSYRKDLVDAHDQIIQLQYVLTKTENALKANEDDVLQLQKALTRIQEQALKRSLPK